MPNPATSARRGTPEEGANRPVDEVRIGRIKAAIWANPSDNGVRHNVTFSRLYKEGDEWRDTDSFGRDDLLLLAKVADRAHTRICDMQSATERDGAESG